MPSTHETEVAGNGATTTETAPAKRRGTVTRDPEMVAITRICTMIDELDEAEATRVVRYVAEKFARFLS